MPEIRETPRRGDMFYIAPAPIVGHEQQMGRPAIIVSRDGCAAGVVQVVPLTTSPRREAGGYHVQIDSAPRPSVALCEQIKTVDAERVGEYAGTVTPEEQETLDAALASLLGLTPPTAQRGGGTAPRAAGNAARRACGGPHRGPHIQRPAAASVRGEAVTW